MRTTKPMSIPTPVCVSFDGNATSPVTCDQLRPPVYPRLFRVIGHVSAPRRKSIARLHCLGRRLAEAQCPVGPERLAAEAGSKVRDRSRGADRPAAAPRTLDSKEKAGRVLEHRVRIGDTSGFHPRHLRLDAVAGLDCLRRPGQSMSRTSVMRVIRPSGPNSMTSVPACGIGGSPPSPAQVIAIAPQDPRVARRPDPEARQRFMCLDDEGGERHGPDDIRLARRRRRRHPPAPDLFEESSRPPGLVPRPLVSLVGFLGSEHR